MRLSIGKSSELQEAVAAAQAVSEALLDAEHPFFALVLSAGPYDQDELAAALTSRLQDLPWAGCTTAGLFSGTTFLSQGVMVGVFSSREARAGVGVGGPVSADGRSAGRAAVTEALAALPPASPGWHRALIMLTAVEGGNATQVLRGAAEEAGGGGVWAGGGAGGELPSLHGSARTAQYCHGRAYGDHVVAVVLDSDCPLGAGIRHGWRPYGPPSLVTRTRGAEAVEFDYEPAFEVYQRTVQARGDRVSLEDFGSFAVTHPLGIPQADGEHVIRDPLSIGAEGSLACLAEVPDGSLVRIMEGDRQGLIAAAFEAARAARDQAGHDLGGCLVFDCVSRSLMLGEDVGQELAAFERGLGFGVPTMGCLTFGEVGSLGTGLPQFHNKTAVLLALSV